MTVPATTASSLGVMPLPVRVEPGAGESWVGYTQRVADFYGISWRTLMSGCLGRYLSTGETAVLKRTSGIAVTVQTVAQLARYFRLSADEVHSMHLIQFHGSALHFPETAREVFDPRKPKPPARRWSLALGPVWPPRRVPSCPECRRERPEHWPLSWRLRWHVICVHHRRLIIDTSDPTASLEISQNAVLAQQTILNRLSPSLPHRRFFTDLHRAAIRKFRKEIPRLHDSLCEVRPADLASLLADLVAEALQPSEASYPLAGVGGHVESVRVRIARSSSPTQRIRIHLPLRRKVADAREVAKLPLLLPMRWFVPDLSDLSYPMPIQQGRAAAALAAYLLASGGDVAAGRSRYGQRLHGATRLARLLDRLAEEGRSERYWEAAQAATNAVLTEGVDYPERASRMADPALHETALAIVPVANPYPLLLRTWIVDQWACTFTSTYRPRLSTTNGRIEEFDREYGPKLTRVLEQHLESAVG